MTQLKNASMCTGYCLLAVMSVLTMPAWSQTATPLEPYFYREFMLIDETKPGGMPSVPVGKSGVVVTIDFLRAKLGVLKEKQDALKDQCLGLHGERQVATIRGRRVLLNPTWMRNCNGYAKLLTEGVGALDQAFPVWNKFAGTAYASPRGDKSLLVAWTERKRQFVHFDGSGCDDASQQMAIPESRLGNQSVDEIYKRWQGMCSAEWRAIFDPKGEPDSKASKSVVGKGESIDDELAAIAQGGYTREMGSTPEMARLKSVQDAIAQRRSSGDTAVSALEKGVKSEQKAGSLGDVEIFGGKTGKLLEATLDPNSTELEDIADLGISDALPQESKATDGACDVQSQMALTDAQVKAVQDRTLAMEPWQRDCTRARAAVLIETDSLNFAVRCNLPASDILYLQSTLKQSRANVEHKCATARPRPDATKCPNGQVNIGLGAGLNPNAKPVCADPNVNPFGNPNATP